MRKTIICVALLAALGACTERELRHTAIGAAAGTAGAVVLDGDPVKGAIIGGAGGLVWEKL